MRAAIAEVAIVNADNQGQQAPQVPQRVTEDLTDDDPYWGPEDAPVTIVEFSDYLCPYCGRHNAQTIPLLQENYGDRVRYVYRDFPGVGGDRAYDTAMAAQCAGDQGYYWEYHALLFGDQTALSAGDKDALRTLLISYAESLDLDVDQFTGCFDDQDYLTDVNLDRAAGQRNGVSGTPTFFINGQILVGAQAYSTFASIIDEELALADAESETGS
jgi:protein-disulfide isomerase